MVRIEGLPHMRDVDTSHAPDTEIKPCADGEVHDDHVWIASQSWHCLGRKTSLGHDMAIGVVKGLIADVFDRYVPSTNAIFHHIRNGTITAEEVGDEFMKVFDPEVSSE